MFELDQDKMLPLGLAAMYGKTNIVKILIEEKKANVNARGKVGINFYHMLSLLQSRLTNDE
jgi:hypothetical protein